MHATNDSVVERVVERARATIAQFEMLPPGGMALVLISGGADSTALVRLLANGELAEDIQIRALHVNHLLRGDSADADEAFVRDLCAGLAVPLHVVRYDVAAFAEEQGLNLEDAGRRVRYRFAGEELDAACASAGLAPAEGRIAVGHTLDDRIETFLMRLAQGAGAKGLTSLRPVRGRVVRPLADCSREDIRDYLRELGQEWREDHTNLDTTRLRARIRHELLPVLRDINPRVHDALARTLEILGDEDDLLEEMAEAFARDFAEYAEGGIRFDRTMMRTLSRPMRRRALRAALKTALPEASRLEFEHVEALVVGIEDDSFARDLPEGIRAVTEYDKMIVSRGFEEVPALAPHLLPVPGVLELGDAGTIRAEESNTRDSSGTPTSIVVDVGEEPSDLVVEGPREGDRMRPLGMDGTKKVSDLLVDAKVPRRARGVTPVVRDGEHVVWVAGVRMSEDYKVTSETTTAVRLTWEPTESTV
ncbi:MAG: tRNA lysidine(34) synthetase TilS [Coriobacteriia bacterium]|nr:tRNA lysidine(34) synthetase TilS [Coriobacteriia bacterium]